MELEFSIDQLEMRDLVRQVLAGACPASLVRNVAEGRTTAESLWQTMGELSWTGVAIPTELGGLGLGFVEVCLVAEELGRVVAPGPYLGTVTQFAPMLMEAQASERRKNLLAQIAAGSMIGALAVSESNRWDLCRIETTARQTADKWIVSGSKTAVLDGDSADEILVVARGASALDREALCAVLIPRDRAHIRKRAVIDPTLELVDIDLCDVEVESDRMVISPNDPDAATRIHRAVDEATVALAASTIGTCRSIFESTLQYAKDRTQFGRPIGSFQALKHRLADMYLSVERAHALVYFAVATIAEDDIRRAETSALAKAVVGECQRLAAQDGLQLHGGTGYTWENDLHFSLKRAKVGDVLFGGAVQHRARLAAILGLDGSGTACD